MFCGYDDIKGSSRPVYREYPAMTAHDRAAQFSPFAALTGYEDAVTETARFTGSRRELTDDEENDLNVKLNEIENALPESRGLRITYFKPDDRKDGGSYVTVYGTVRIIDHYSNELVMTDGMRILINDLAEICFTDENKRNDI